MDNLRLKAKKDAENFLENDYEYRMGYVDAEKPHHLTKNMSYVYQKSVSDGIKILFSVDREMAERAEKTLISEEYGIFADCIRNTVSRGNKVVFSGCGSSGRLSMRLEASWREAIYGLEKLYPEKKDKLEEKIPLVRNIMTGGDYAVIRAVESFEDSSLLGEEQANEMGIIKGDLLVGVTATGETTSILGTAKKALKNGADVYMLICSDPGKTSKNMKRVREVFDHENCSIMLLDCGQMAVTGSTRMQSSTFEELASYIALEAALNDILKSLDLPYEEIRYSEMAKSFKNLCSGLSNEKNIAEIAVLTQTETDIYKKGGKVTYYSDDYLLDVLTDTTERAPTFMTPPFRSSDFTDGEESWAFVKNPNYDTKSAWEKCFFRTPNCIDWDKTKYTSFGLTEKQISKIPKIDLNALEKFEIGNERAISREGKQNIAVWIDFKSAPSSFEETGKNYGKIYEFSLEKAEIKFEKTKLDIFEHLGMKMILNVLSTGTMAILGRIQGNWMINLAMSNKKLIDRSARIVEDLCNIPYEQALEEVFYSYEFCEANGILRSPAGMTLERLTNKKINQER